MITIFYDYIFFIEQPFLSFPDRRLPLQSLATQWVVSSCIIIL